MEHQILYYFIRKSDEACRGKVTLNEGVPKDLVETRKREKIMISHICTFAED